MKILITLLKPLSFLPALLMMYIIFSFSAQPGEVSGNLSYKISYEIIETKSELLSENLSSEEIAYKADGIHYYVRKAAHIAGIVCVGFAGLDEYHQSFVDARTPAIKDVGIDSIGAFIGILLVQAFCWSVLNNPNKKKKKRSH